MALLGETFAFSSLHQGQRVWEVVRRSVFLVLLIVVLPHSPGGIPGVGFCMFVFVVSWRGC